MPRRPSSDAVPLALAALAALTMALKAQEHPHAPPATVPLQPLAAQVRRLESALGFLGEPLLQVVRPVAA